MNHEVLGVYYCPKCYAATVDVGSVIGGTSSCRGCAWKGSSEDLIFSPQAIGDVSQILGYMADAVKKLFFEQATPIARFLLHWGFTRQEVLRDELPVYIADIAVAFCTSVLKTKEKLAIKEAERRADEHRRRTT